MDEYNHFLTGAVEGSSNIINSIEVLYCNVSVLL